MTENIITSKDTIKQENNRDMEAQTRPKRKERPPLELISAGGKIIQNPTAIEILDEIDLKVIPQIRVVYDLFAEMNEEFFDYPKGKAAISNTLFVALE